MTDRIGGREDRGIRINRRRFLAGGGAIAAGSLLAGYGGFGGLKALAQDPPAGCPTPAVGGTPFVPGSDKRPIVLRKSISFFSPAELTELENAFAALRALDSSDPRTWVLQADIHALNCHQCFNDSTQIHSSWNFFPWHRAYLYYYERILGSLVGNIDGFRLPYWDWENIRNLPDAYRTPASSANSLFDSIRDAGMAAGGNLPATHGTAARVSLLLGMTDFATFGGTTFSGPSSKGACESNPHDIVHGDVGQPGSPFRDMGNLGFAARDPLFFAHHCNIDKLWSKWNSLADESLPPGSYQNPTDAGFLNARWSFYDENKQVVSISAADVLDHVDNLRYEYVVRLFIPPLLVAYACQLLCCPPPPEVGPIISIDPESRAILLQRAGEDFPAALVLRGVVVPRQFTGSFDIFAVRRNSRTPLGSLYFFPDEASHEMAATTERRPMTLVLDITHALRDLLSTTDPASIQVFRRKRRGEGEDHDHDHDHGRDKDRDEARRSREEKHECRDEDEHEEKPAFVLSATGAEIRVSK
jgi:hypothetical protein